LRYAVGRIDDVVTLQRIHAADGEREDARVLERRPMIDLTRRLSVQGETPRLKQQQSRTIESIRTPFARRITGGTIYVDGGVHIVA
jgi:hypothetical protein